MNEVSRRLAFPMGDPPHRELRRDMCESQLLGGDGATRYLVSVLSGEDCLGVRHAEYVSMARSIAAGVLGKAADRWEFSQESLCYMWPLFLDAYRQAHPAFMIDRTQTTEDRAVVQRLIHPDLDDVAIAQLAATTTKQLSRFSAYKYLLRFRRPR